MTGSVLLAVSMTLNVVVPVPLETPPFGYELDEPAGSPAEGVLPRLTLLGCTANGTVDYEEWFGSIGCWPSVTFHGGGVNDAIRGGTPPSGVDRILRAPGNTRFHLYQLIRGSEAVFAVYGDPPNRFGCVLKPRILVVREPDGDTPLVLDFLSYAHGPADLQDEADYTFQQIRWAHMTDGVLYVSNAHRTYAESSGGLNAFVTAIDPETLTVLWRSEPLVSNSENFLVIGDAILTGYGFTDEPDLLYTLDRHTGETIGSIQLPSAPEYLWSDGGTLLVRCVGWDLEFAVEY